MSEDKKKEVEAALFASGKRMRIEEIAKLCKITQEEAEKILKELKKDYESKDSSLYFQNEHDIWKLTVKDKFLDVARKLGVEAELPKSVIETLAVIAWRAPMKQSDVIEMRTNKAYAHLDELEKLGYITRKKLGRTKLIRLSEKFFDYFDLPQKNIQELFRNQESLAKLIEIKEKEIQDIKEEHSRKLEQSKKEEAKVEIIDTEKADGEKEKAKIKIVPEETLGKLEVFEEKEESPDEAVEEGVNKEDVNKKVEEMLKAKEDGQEKKEKQESELVGSGKEVKEPGEQEPRDLIDASRSGKE